MSVAICVLTYKRPRLLANLLQSLDALRFEGDAPAVRVVVVDNDPEASAQAACLQAAERMRWPVQYVTEPTRGIAPARNAALCAASADDYVAFIDDDEEAEPDWLNRLLAVQRQYDADVVTGPLLPRYGPECPQWIRRGRFFEPRRRPTGTQIDRAYTNNVLVGRRVLDAFQHRFDPRLALMGGEDTHFFRRVAHAGFRIIWADDAIVHEEVPASRANAGWILRRAYRLGLCSAFVDRDLHPALRACATVAPAAFVRIAKGVLFLPLLALGGRHLSVTYLRHICYGAGMLAGLGGLRYDEYRTIHGN